MAAPKLRIPASGLGGSGYALPPILGDNGKPVKVPGVTTVLGSAGDPGGLIQWNVNATAAYAVANLETLYQKSEEQGFHMLKWYHARAKESDFDDPEVDIHNYHSGVLNEAAELGTLTHEWIEAHLAGEFTPELVRDEQADMIDTYLEWHGQHEVEVVQQEVTVYGYIDGMPYAGTLDAILRIDGVPYLIDVKTSAAIRPSHVAQLAAYGSAVGMMVEADPFAQGAQPYTQKDGEVTYWLEEPLPDFSNYGVLQVRPGTYNHKGEWVPAYTKFTKIPHSTIEAGHQFFRGAMHVRRAETDLKKMLK